MSFDAGVIKNRVQYRIFEVKKIKNKVLHWHPSPSTQEYALIYIERKQVQISLHADIIASCRYCKIIGKKKMHKRKLEEKKSRKIIFSRFSYTLLIKTYFLYDQYITLI